MTDTEKYLVVWFEDEDIFTLTDSSNHIVKRSLYELKTNIYGVLSSQEDIAAATPENRYAISTELAREVFGWDV